LILGGTTLQLKDGTCLSLLENSRNGLSTPDGEQGSQIQDRLTLYLTTNGGVEHLAGSPDCKSGSTDMQVRLLSPPLDIRCVPSREAKLASLITLEMVSFTTKKQGADWLTLYRDVSGDYSP
jgi:hypothetical protein